MTRWSRESVVIWVIAATALFGIGQLFGLWVEVAVVAVLVAVVVWAR